MFQDWIPHKIQFEMTNWQKVMQYITIYVLFKVLFYSKYKKLCSLLFMCAVCTL